jgi:hypothetical protein
MESAAFNLLRIEVLDENFPEGDSNKEVTDRKYSWQCGFNFKIIPQVNESYNINIDISFRMYPIDDPEEKILFLKTRSLFSVKGKIGDEAKLNLLYHFIAISSWNFQGTYAAKTEGTIYAAELPPEPNFRQFEEKFKIQIVNEWK